MTVHVILPVHNRAEVTRGFIACLRAQTLKDYALLVVDDGSTDRTDEIVRHEMQGARTSVLRGDGTLWWAGALQLAFEHLRKSKPPSTDSVLIINDDVEIEPDFLRNGEDELDLHPHAAIQAQSVDRAGGESDYRGIFADLWRLSFSVAAAGTTPNCLSTRGLMMRMPVFLASGGFRPQWLPHYLSDYEFTMRLARHGVELRVAQNFRLTMDGDLSGEEAYRGTGLREFLAITFSNRAKYNPRHWSAFVVLTCPAWMLPIHLGRIWLRFAFELLRALTRRGAALRHG